jgi:hypothetical protein
VTFNQAALENVTEWCRGSLELASERREARARFFGQDDPRPVEYWPGAGEAIGRERRFLGYFLFECELPSGEKPVEIAIRRLYDGSDQTEALAAVARTRFVMGLVRSITGRNVYLQLEDEQFEVRNPVCAANLVTGTAVSAYLVPVRHGYWIPGPGWVNLPFQLGPVIRSHFKSMQFDQISLERLLQSRGSDPDEPRRPPPPEDLTLGAAVDRITAWARERNCPALVLSNEAWSALVCSHLENAEDTANELVSLASNVWNNTPQPDRGGRTANEMASLRPRK